MQTRVMRTIGTALIIRVDDGWHPVVYEVRDAAGNHRGEFKSVQAAMPKAERIGYPREEYYQDKQGRICEGQG